MVLIEALAHQKKSSALILVKQNTRFGLGLHYNGDNSCLFVMEKKSLSLKPIM